MPQAEFELGIVIPTSNDGKEQAFKVAFVDY
jgi:hypothetical protein